MSKWFTNFIESFENGEYHGQYGRIKPWQYKNLMETARSNNWKMLTQKQLDVFLRNMEIKRSTWEEFGQADVGDRKVKIRISTQTGFATINIS